MFAVPLAGSWVSLFGFCVYGAYDLTNLATLRGWPWPLTVSVVDLAWGGAVTATAAAFLATRAV